MTHPTPADMPNRAPSFTPIRRNGALRSSAHVVLAEIIAQISADGATPNGEPHALLDFLPDLLSATAAFDQACLARRVAYDAGQVKPREYRA